jgi:hypothetical protein
MSLEPGQNIISGKDHRRMADQAVKVSKLDLFDQFQVLLAHFEKHFDIPPFTAQPYDFLFGQGSIGGQNSQPRSLSLATKTIRAFSPLGSLTMIFAFILARPRFFLSLA